MDDQHRVGISTAKKLTGLDDAAVLLGILDAPSDHQQDRIDRFNAGQAAAYEASAAALVRSNVIPSASLVSGSRRSSLRPTMTGVLTSLSAMAAVSG